jgi:uncharacterized protein (DUF2235 family)
VERFAMTKIILLSDGTGNSAGKVWRTNVWRTFQALDLVSSNQLAIYDDGVGTSSFKPMAILGGVFGFGLRRNVLNLYKFACRTYVSGDEIFGFRFSRGAFTIRVVMGLIADQGLVAFTTEEQLDQRAKAAYRANRAKGRHKTLLEFPWWIVRDYIPELLGRWFGSTPYNDGARQVNSIKFLGLWDTVAAYGLPIDEMTRGVSRWIWPLELPNRRLHDKVERACHAMSLDDERTTFHPILWDESQQIRRPVACCEAPTTRLDRICQVWFMGVHSNVGGGYPDDALAHVPLCWILEEALDAGLLLKPGVLAEYRLARDKDGRLYDSRSGMGGYYRYGPRKVSDLSDSNLSSDSRDCVTIRLPKIHESVFERMKVGAHLYAPIGLPEKYEVVTSDRELIPSACARYEKGDEAVVRNQAQERTLWTMVWQRRVVYFLTIAASAFLVLYPVFSTVPPEAELSNPLRLVSDMVRLLGNFAPSGTSRWIQTYARDPLTFLIWCGIVGLLISWGSSLKATITDHMRQVWRKSLLSGGATVAHPPRTQASGPLTSKTKKLTVLAVLAAVAFYPFVVDPKGNLFLSLDEPLLSLAKILGYCVRWVVHTCQHAISLVSSRAAELFSEVVSLLDQSLNVLCSSAAPIIAILLLFVFALSSESVYGIISNPGYKDAVRFLKMKIAPMFFAIAFVYLGLSLTNHYVFNIRDASGIKTPSNQRKDAPLCTGTNIPMCVGALQKSNASMPGCVETCREEIFFVDTRDLCTASKLLLDQNKKYKVTISKATAAEIEQNKLDSGGGEWTFMGRASSVRGIPLSEASFWRVLADLVLTPLKRSLDRPFGRLILRFGPRGNEEDFVDPDVGSREETLTEIIKPGLESELFVYVNKPVSGIWPKTVFRDVNSGIAKVSVKRVPD